MAAKSKHWADVYVWILEDLIPSCVSMEQCDGVEKLVDRYSEIYNDPAITELHYAVDKKRIFLLSS